MELRERTTQPKLEDSETVLRTNNPRQRLAPTGGGGGNRMELSVDSVSEEEKTAFLVRNNNCKDHVHPLQLPKASSSHMFKLPKQ